MNNTKISNPVRLIAFFLTGVILICTFGFTVDGWQNNDNQQVQQYPNANNKPTDKTETPTDKEPEPENNPDEPEIYIPAYTNKLTGLECSEELASKTPLAFVMDSNADYYGISASDIICEIPTEDDGSRLVAFLTESDNLWKIGSMAPSRNYIANIACYFGGLAISVGNDDQIKYDSCNAKNQTIDLSTNNGYHYTEYSKFNYTNCDLISAAIKSAQMDNIGFINSTLPFNFSDFGSELVLGGDSAKKVAITVSDNNHTELVFDVEKSTYSIYKNGKAFFDALNGENLNFTNCFILFADSITYDNAECSQMVMDTVGNGIGYYVSAGTVMAIKWSATTAGVMTFYDDAGEKLVINRGNSYISYLKSSKTESVTFS